ncbi:aminoglycoside phosphotransferase family protein [Woodsholea maritima]|uniref:aminoglycoside phosphotransferase family protein n=1 Tax=Woodsholea maritima TaxID=240237 RepID=UPI0003810624|nr:phosphotransferase [Woodsholea maritima]
MHSSKIEPQSRDQARLEFVAAGDWAGCEIIAFPGDASTRSYYRLVKDGKTAILMDAPSGAEAPACPPDADWDMRAKLGYNAEARLSACNTGAFCGLAQGLTQRGFSAPRIWQADLGQGFLILEDLGDNLFARDIEAGAHEGAYYAGAIDVLGALYRSSFLEYFDFQDHRWWVGAYDHQALRAETHLFTNWYIKFQAEQNLSADELHEWDAIWDQLWPALEAHAPGLILRDFHAENLLWLPQREGQARVGLLDFQDALFGHPAYDLVSLLEDARRDVSADLVEPLKDRFFEAAKLKDREAFEAAYAILGAQRNAKILGIFVRLAVRDKKGKYLDLIPRVARHFVKNINHPLLKDLKAFVTKHAEIVMKDAQR